MTKFKLLHFYRGIAAILVMLVHLTQIFKERLSITLFNNLFIIGNVGVDFFFVLSGFIITYSHYTQIGDRTLLLRYIKKRIIRVFPMYWVILLGTILLYAVAHKNIFQLLHINFINFIRILLLLPGPSNPLPQTWSLSYELLFYIFFSVFFFIQSKKTFLYLIVLIGSCILMINFIPKFHFLAPLFDILLFDFCIGAFGTFLFFYLKNKYLRSYLFILLSVVYLLFFWLIYQYNYNQEVVIHNNFRIVTFGFPLGLLVLFSTLSEAKHTIKWVTKPMILLGDISYSLFLVHFISIVFFANVLKSHSQLITNQYLMYLSVFLTFFATLSVAWFFHVCIEKPLTKYLTKGFLTK